VGCSVYARGVEGRATRHWMECKDWWIKSGEGRREVSEDFFSLYLTQALCVCALSEWSVRAVDVVRAGWRWGDMFF
jgi:hypothetical protein